MKLMHPSLPFLSSIFLILIPLISSQSCQRTCGKQTIKYPFGTGPGCGDLRFQTSINCNNQQQLTFITHTGCYPITTIDYSNHIIYISDPSMSTCSCTKPSKGFGLDSEAPFTFDDNNIFALLDCSIASSPIYRYTGEYNNITAPLCDSKGAEICSLLYSCQPISKLNVPISTCCVYAPVDLGPSYEMDLEKLECSSYLGIYGFNWVQTEPERWNYGVALKYKFNYDNDYPILCDHCEKSNGACGYSGDYNSFVCNCPSGLNTSTNCFYGAEWSNGFRLVPRQNGIWLIYALALPLICVLL